MSALGYGCRFGEYGVYYSCNYCMICYHFSCHWCNLSTYYNSYLSYYSFMNCMVYKLSRYSRHNEMSLGLDCRNFQCRSCMDNGNNTAIFK